MKAKDAVDAYIKADFESMDIGQMMEFCRVFHPGKFKLYSGMGTGRWLSGQSNENCLRSDLIEERENLKGARDGDMKNGTHIAEEVLALGSFSGDCSDVDEKGNYIG